TLAGWSECRSLDYELLSVDFVAAIQAVRGRVRAVAPLCVLCCVVFLLCCVVLCCVVYCLFVCLFASLFACWRDCYFSSFSFPFLSLLARSLCILSSLTDAIVCSVSVSPPQLRPRLAAARARLGEESVSAAGRRDAHHARACRVSGLYVDLFSVYLFIYL